MREIELRRHAKRQPGVDALSDEGRAQAEDVGRTMATDYASIFVSPARRAAETVAWFLRASGQQLPVHAVVPGLASAREDEWRSAATAGGSSRVDAMAEQDPEMVGAESRRLAEALEELFEQVPEGERALAVGHTPLIEAAVYGLTGVIVEPLGECEGVSVILEDEGRYRIRELRLSPGAPSGTG